MINLGRFTKQGKDIILKELDNGCVECLSHCKDKDGYVRIWYNQKHERLFRVLYEREYGAIPVNNVIRHICDNPGCCNIKHLIIGTQQDNVHDMWKRNRQRDYTQNLCLGENNKQSKLTKQQVLEIYKSTKSNKELAKQYGVSDTTISYIKRQIIWKWFTDTLK